MKTKLKWIIGVSIGIIVLAGIIWLFSDTGFLSQVSPQIDSASTSSISGGGGSP